MIGQTISHYRVLERLGQGGMGVVYKAHDEKLDRPVALKILKPEFMGNAEHRQRFLREAHSAAAITHPFIASIYDAGESDGTLFIAMEYVEGRTLRALLDQGVIPVPDATRYGTEIAEGLATAHQSHLVHRDLKPDNVMLASNGHVKILDFGLAKAIEKRDEAATVSMTVAETPTALTTEGAILGTPAYMSPEQTRGEPVDSRSDIFSFGSTVYEMVTGRAAFRGPTHQDTLASILRDQPVSVRELNADVPADLQRIISRCLNKNPEERYNDTRDLVVALKDLPHDSGPTVPQSVAAQSRRWGRLFALIAVVVAIVGLVWVQPWKLADVQEQPADPAPHAHPNWILVADFEGPPDDPNLSIAARELVTSSLEQSDIVTPLTRPQLRRGLELAMKPETTQIAGDIARELAVRASARFLVEGRVDRLLSGFSIVLRALNMDSGETVASVSAVAEDEDAFVSTLDRASRDLRKELGDRSGSIQATRNAAEAMTPSFEAYQRYVRATALHSEVILSGGTFLGKSGGWVRGGSRQIPVL